MNLILCTVILSTIMCDTNKSLFRTRKDNLVCWLTENSGLHKGDSPAPHYHVKTESGSKRTLVPLAVLPPSLERPDDIAT